MNAAIALLLKENYAIEPSSITKLEGYDSLNFKIDSAQGTFVLKQYKSSKEILALLKAEHEIFETLSQVENQEFPKTILSLDGNPFVQKETNAFRVLRYLNGSFLGDVTHSPTLCGSFGKFLARLNSTLKSEYFAAIAAKQTPWDLQYFKKNYKYLKYITDARNRNLVDYFFLQYDENIYPIQNQLRKCIIHNDGNDWNVLTKNQHVSGLIDFGDMCYSWLINELAVALTYLLMNKERPLNVAKEFIKGYHAIHPLKEIELEVLYYLIAARLCTSVCNSAYTKTIKPDSAYITISEKPAWALLHKWLTINPKRARDVFYQAARFETKPVASLKNQHTRRQQVLSGALSLSYKEPLFVTRSAFQYMYDIQGNTILDAYNNIMLTGHSHPSIVRAGQRTMARLNTNTRYVYEELVAYSERLLNKFPAKLNKVIFVNSGSAASDLAIRMAKAHNSKNKILVLEHGYHGNTSVGIDVSHYKYNHKGGAGKQAHILETSLPNAYTSGYKDDGTAGRHFATKTNATIAENLNDIAAFIAEPIVGCGGQVPLAKGYLQEVYPKIRAQGGICISDEVQVGFGRLGNYFWGYEMHNVIPDMVILGKPMGNGHPIGAVVTTTEIADSFDNGMEFFSSFGGNPVSCAIGDAVLQLIEEEELQGHAKETGNYLIDMLRQLQVKHKELADVRGCGLFIGVEIIDTQTKQGTQLAKFLKNELRRKHILIGTDGPFNNVLKIKPPLSFTKENCDTLCTAIDSILSSLHKN